MESLSGLLLAPTRRDRFHAECIALIERFVATRKGVRGAAMRTVLGAVRKGAADGPLKIAQTLAPDFALALDPLFQEFRQQQRPDNQFREFLMGEQSRVAAALLATADSQAEGSEHPLTRMFYTRLRNGVDADIKDLVPMLAQTLTQVLVDDSATALN